MNDERAATVAATLRYLAGGPLCPTLPADDAKWLLDTAEQIDIDDDHGWERVGCCPLCEETICDDGCPLGPLRPDFWTRTRTAPSP